MTTFQKTIIGAALVAAIATTVHEALRASGLTEQVEALQQQQAQLAEQIKQLQEEREESMRQLAAAREENELSNSNNLRLNATRSTGLADRPARHNPQPDLAFAEDAAKTILETIARGDSNAFSTNFASPAVPRELYDDMFNQLAKLLSRSRREGAWDFVVEGAGQDAITGSDSWLALYTIGLNDGSETKFRLNLALDPASERCIVTSYSSSAQ